MELKERLEKEAEFIIAEAKGFKTESKEYHEHITNAAILIDKINEIKKIEQQEQKDKELAATERKQNIWKNAITIGGIVLPLTVSLWAAMKSFAFDNEGKIFTSTLGKGAITNLFPKMKW